MTAIGLLVGGASWYMLDIDLCAGLAAVSAVSWQRMDPIEWLTRVLSDPARKEIVRALARNSQSDHDLAARLGLVDYEIDEPLQSLHENGIIEQDDDGTWRLSRRVRTKPAGELMELTFELPDGSTLEMGLLPPGAAFPLISADW